MSKEIIASPVFLLGTEIQLELESDEAQILDQYCCMTGYTHEEAIHQLVRQFLEKQDEN